MKSNSTNLIILIAVALIMGAGGFFAGSRYQKSKSPANFNARGGFTRTGQSNGAKNANGNAFGRPVSGTITNVDGNNLTVKTQDGSSKIIILSDSTKINKTTAGAKSDLKTGEQVMVIGQESSDSTITATTVSVGQTLTAPSGNNPPPQN